ncbi:PA2169 family four-helix-bundle protein [Sphingobacterium sp. LRF_L2]|uniref:PA2169 family four-helix-bundle protein n=1 Tax=Sphingobacterium sp. LRF_L2 TaxID=3369421 RepID=UPI003F64087D
MEDYRELVHDLIQINNDRIAGYTKAIELLIQEEDQDLRKVFVYYRSQTQKHVTQLGAFALNLNLNQSKAPIVQGELFRIWMDIKTTITGTDRYSILMSCDQAEGTYKQAYEQALRNLLNVPLSVTNTIRQQAEHQYMEHNHIKTLRDAG